ncbi:hypothetical protein [Pelagicoccus mobilis]|uniref:Pectate lyase superfamily protein domain-containing protein n=2 Tax=Pelagicoccus mobilis TaxID=415221 RepID=A0A934RYB4_9BACT|nr:hypothetical protein [Pelagicoccus mobilis]MBK1877081.1 hypothetical protein [Pelagicoccus mobilis]
MVPLVAQDFLTYEDFGAVGDGVHDDLPSICAAHEHANANGLPVKSKPDATYHLGSRALTAIIATDTDWSTSRFTIDDREVENHKASLFEVRSLLPMETLPIQKLTRDQTQIEWRGEQDYLVTVYNDKVKRYIRRGLNQNAGSDQRDSFILKKDGTITSPIDWDYDRISKVEARPIDADTLTISGGVFTTIANNMKQEVGYNYWYRNIEILRSNTVLDGLTHYVAGETAVGHPYRGFISVMNCANIELRNCFATGHKVYKTIGSAGKPVSMGSYDYNANSVVNFSMINCRMNHILDRTRWGVIGTNFCKNILLEGCELSRMDAHMGVSGTYTIKDSTLGYMGLNAIGRGQLTIENSTIHGSSLIGFREDYGSTWEGDVTIRNTRWLPVNRGAQALYMFGLRNDGQHDFGYTCYMPRNVTIEDLFIDDSQHEGSLYFFSDPGSEASSKAPHPFILTQKVQMSGLSVASGSEVEVSPNAELEERIKIVCD